MDRMGSQKKTSYAMLCYDWFSEEGKYSPRCQTMLSPMHMFFLKCCAFSLSENGRNAGFLHPAMLLPPFFSNQRSRSALFWDIRSSAINFLWWRIFCHYGRIASHASRIAKIPTKPQFSGHTNPDFNNHLNLINYHHIFVLDKTAGFTHKTGIHKTVKVPPVLS